MPRITYITADGAAREVDVEEGATVMEGAKIHNVPGMDADCGGACACSTCHVYVAPDWLPRLPEKGPMEDDMLDFAVDRNERSRLACQLRVGPECDGLVVHMPERQF